jgi:hypothetical protein
MYKTCCYYLFFLYLCRYLHPESIYLNSKCLFTIPIGCNDLKTLPKMLLPALEHLNVSHNQFDEFPDVILRHTTLR